MESMDSWSGRGGKRAGIIENDNQPPYGGVRISGSASPGSGPDEPDRQTIVTLSPPPTVQLSLIAKRNNRRPWPAPTMPGLTFQPLLVRGPCRAEFERHVTNRFRCDPTGASVGAYADGAVADARLSMRLCARLPASSCALPPNLASSSRPPFPFLLLFLSALSPALAHRHLSRVSTRRGT